MNNDCLYCNKNQLQKDLMIEICELNASTVFLFKEQTHKGRCIVAYKGHAVELYELDDKELSAFMQDVNKVAKAIAKIFTPAKINYGAYSDKLPHLHMHLVPKYIDGVDYGGVFQMNPQKVYLSESEYEEIIAAIRKYLE